VNKNDKKHNDNQKEQEITLNFLENNEKNGNKVGENNEKRKRQWG